jgi:galactose mutarotase-like enzyme
MEIEAITYQGLQALALFDEKLRAVVIPAWGGKIASLYDRQRQREWLHTNPHFKYELPSYDGDYVGMFDVGGFDECFPNVGAGQYPAWPWQAVSLPDHGEVWALPWSARQEDGSLTLAVYGVRLPYRLEKRLSLADGCLRLAYRVENPTPFALPFVWSSHPLLDVQPGMRLEVPARSARVDGCSARFAELTEVEPGEIVPWPQIGGLDLSIIPGAEASMAVKLVARELGEGRAALVDPLAGARFEFRFDPALVPQIGLWLNYGGWSGKAGAPPYYNIGFEPCIGGRDRLDLAMEADEYGLLPPESPLNWWLEIRLS